MKTLDVSGLSCPEPVLRTQETLRNLPAKEKLEVLVDTVTGRENILRMVTHKGWQVDVSKTEDGFRLLIWKN